MLSEEKYHWRSMEALSDAIGTDEEATAALLLEIGARKSGAVFPGKIPGKFFKKA